MFYRLVLILAIVGALISPGCSREDRVGFGAALMQASENMRTSRSVYCSTQTYGRGARSKVVTSCY